MHLDMTKYFCMWRYTIIVEVCGLRSCRDEEGNQERLSGQMYIPLILQASSIARPKKALENGTNLGHDISNLAMTMP